MDEKTTGFVDAILKEYYVEPILKELRRDFNRTAFGQEPKRYELLYNTCHEHGLEHDWEAGKVHPGGICWECEGEGLQPPNDMGDPLWQDCYTCDGKGYTFTQYSQHCARCGFTEVKGR